MKKVIKMGIYKILNNVNGKFYIGSSNNLRKREREHFGSLRSNSHYNKHLQRSFNKYGEISFKFIILEQLINIEDLLIREQYFLDLFRCYDSEIGYNISPSANGTTGLKLSNETKKKISIAHMGKSPGKWSEERKEQLSESRKGEGNPMFGKKMSEKRKLLQWMSRGENNPTSKITDKIAMTIKIMLRDGMKTKKISKILDISDSIVWNIKYNKTWKHIKLEI